MSIEQYRAPGEDRRDGMKQVLNVNVFTCEGANTTDCNGVNFVFRAITLLPWRSEGGGSYRDASAAAAAADGLEMF